MDFDHNPWTLWPNSPKLNLETICISSGNMIRHIHIIIITAMSPSTGIALHLTFEILLYMGQLPIRCLIAWFEVPWPYANKNQLITTWLGFNMLVWYDQHPTWWSIRCHILDLLYVTWFFGVGKLARYPCHTHLLVKFFRDSSWIFLVLCRILLALFK